MTIMQIAVLSHLHRKVGILKGKGLTKLKLPLLNNEEFKLKDIFGKHKGIGGSAYSLGVISSRGLLVFCFQLLISQVLSNDIL